MELVRCDAADFQFPAIDGVISTYALTLVPEFDEVIRRAAAALAPGKRMVVVDFKAPDAWPTWLLKAVVTLLRPFGVTLPLRERRPWEAVRRHFPNLEIRERYFGTTYVAVGGHERVGRAPRPTRPRVIAPRNLAGETLACGGRAGDEQVTVSDARTDM